MISLAKYLNEYRCTPLCTSLLKGPYYKVNYIYDFNFFFCLKSQPFVVVLIALISMSKKNLTTDEVCHITDNLSDLEGLSDDNSDGWKDDSDHEGKKNIYNFFFV